MLRDSSGGRVLYFLGNKPSFLGISFAEKGESVSAEEQENMEHETVLLWLIKSAQAGEEGVWESILVRMDFEGKPMKI